MFTRARTLAPTRENQSRRDSRLLTLNLTFQAAVYAPARGGLISERRVRLRRDASLPLEKAVLNKNDSGLLTCLDLT